MRLATRTSCQGLRVFALLGIPNDQRVPEAQMNELAASLAPYLDG